MTLLPSKTLRSMFLSCSHMWKPLISYLRIFHRCLIVLNHSFYRWGAIEFPLPFGRVLSPTENFIHSLDEKVSILFIHKSKSVCGQTSKVYVINNWAEGLTFSHALLIVQQMSFLTTVQRIASSYIAAVIKLNFFVIVHVQQSQKVYEMLQGAS